MNAKFQEIILLSQILFAERFIVFRSECQQRHAKSDNSRKNKDDCDTAVCTRTKSMSDVLCTKSCRHQGDEIQLRDRPDHKCRQRWSCRFDTLSKSKHSSLFFVWYHFLDDCTFCCFHKWCTNKPDQHTHRKQNNRCLDSEKDTDRPSDYINHK